ncbi:unnamed protein product [Closterium sp. NIES-53]
MDSGKYVRSDLDRDCAGAPAESSAAAANGVARPDLHSTFGPVLRENTASSTRHHASPLKQQQQHQQEQEEEDDISSFKDSDSLLLKDGSPITDSTHSSHNLKLSSWPFSSNSLISRVFRSPTVLLLLSLIFLLVGLYTLFLQPDSRLSSDTVDLSITSANELLPGQTQDPSPWTQEPGLPFTTSQKHNAADPEPHSDPESDPSHHGPDTVVANFHAAVEKGSFGSEGERGSLSGGESGTWRGKLVWTPQPNRFLLAVCLRGQVNNRIGCLYRHLVLAALLNRTLLVPPVLLSTSLAYCKHGLSGSPCPSVPLPLIWDLAHTRTCLGGDTVLRTDEFAARFGRPLEVHHMRGVEGGGGGWRGWMG